MQAPAKAKASKAAKAPLQPSNASAQGQAIEDIYQKKTQLEHILLRPDTYIGSTEKQQQKMWIHDGAGIRLADIDYVPGLYKIFDEILVNAADNKVRDPKMDMLKVDIDEVRHFAGLSGDGGRIRSGYQGEGGGLGGLQPLNEEEWGRVGWVLLRGLGKTQKAHTGSCFVNKAVYCVRVLHRLQPGALAESIKVVGVKRVQSIMDMRMPTLSQG